MRKKAIYKKIIAAAAVLSISVLGASASYAADAAFLSDAYSSVRNVDVQCDELAQMSSSVLNIEVQCDELTQMSSSVRNMDVAYDNSTDVTSDEGTDESTEEIRLAVDPTDKTKGYAAVLYNGTNGLPTSEANAIAETSEGFIWIGGYSGLVRYDGNSFTRYDSTTGITSVVSLFVDSKDRLWVGTNDNGVAVLDDGELTFFKQVDGLWSSSIRSIIEDEDGNIFIATTNGIGMIDKDMKFHVINIPQLNKEYICEIHPFPGGGIYGVTINGAIFVYKNGKVTAFYDGKKLETGVITTVMQDPENPDYLYLGTESGAIYYGSLSNRLNDLERIDVSPLTYIDSITPIDGVYWICADNGIGVIKNGKFSVLDDLPMNKSIMHVIPDYEGNVWFTSTRQGVMKIVPNEFSDVSDVHNLDNMVVNSTCRYGDVLLIGSDTGLKQISLTGSDKALDGLPIDELADKDTEEIVGNSRKMTTFLDEERIRSIVKGSDGSLWFSTYSNVGLVHYKDGWVKCYTEKAGFPSNRVRVVYERHDGTMMAAISGGMALIKDDKVIGVFDSDSGLSNPEILTVSEDDEGRMLLGSDGDGIYVIEDNNVAHIGTDSGLSSGVVLKIKKDEKRDLFWIITSNSIAYLKDDVVTTITDFPYSNNFDMYENKAGEMWVISSNGIYVVSADDLLSGEPFDYAFYNTDCGLPSFATANSFSELDTDGTLYISGSSKVVSVNIDNFDENISEIKMAVPFVETDEGFIYPDEKGKITVPSNTKRLTIYPYAFTYSLKNPKITYKLIGFDKNETTVSRDKLEPVSYTNLDGGTYRFKMKLMSNVSEEEREIMVVIEKEMAVYEHMWFRILVTVLALMLVGGIVALYFRKKTAELIKKQEENKIFIREMTEAFAKTIDMKDKYTNGHSTRVAEYTAMLTKELGYDEETVDKYYNIALLHDIGKIGIPPEVLNKPGKLTDEEFKIIKSHSAQGYKVLKDISIMPELAIGAGAHHERPDGKGYPKGLKGEEIPRVAQIIAVADTFDAMYSDRPYRKRMNFEKAVSIIKEVSGTQLFPDVVDAFERLVEKGEFRAPDDTGGGTTEDIDNIHKKQGKES